MGLGPVRGFRGLLRNDSQKGGHSNCLIQATVFGGLRNSVIHFSFCCENTGNIRSPRGEGVWMGSHSPLNLTFFLNKGVPYISPRQVKGRRWGVHFEDSLKSPCKFKVASSGFVGERRG